MEEIFNTILTAIAYPIIHILELVGVLIIAYGSLKALYLLLKSKFAMNDPSIKIILGEALSLSLEFKLGAEIIKTVVVRTMDELLILGAVVLLRVVLTFVIHWEVEQAGENKELKEKIVDESKAK